MSTTLSGDARAAYRRLQTQARVLGALSLSLRERATTVAILYDAALVEPATASWRALIAAAARLVAGAHEINEIVPFAARESAALGFFEAIVTENADLLAESRAADVERSCAAARRPGQAGMLERPARLEVALS